MADPRPRAAQQQAAVQEAWAVRCALAALTAVPQRICRGTPTPASDAWAWARRQLLPLACASRLVRDLVAQIDRHCHRHRRGQRPDVRALDRCIERLSGRRSAVDGASVRQRMESSKQGIDLFNGGTLERAIQISNRARRTGGWTGP